MNKEVLEQITKDYEEMQKISKGDFTEMVELEKNPFVQRYKYLWELKQTYYSEDGYCKEPYFWQDVVTKYSDGMIDNTNQIWFWCQDMTLNEYDEMFNAKLGEKLNELVKDDIFSLYFDLENSQKMVMVPISEQENFESINKVIRGDRRIVNSSHRYFSARYEFFKLCVVDGQSTAVANMLEEEKIRRQKVEELKQNDLEALNQKLNAGLINSIEYNNKRQRILAKKLYY